MRIALFGDIHSNYYALEAVLQDMALRGVDRMICLGDITLKGPQPKECVDRVRDQGCTVLLGNADGCYHPDFHPNRFPAQNQSQVAVRADFERHWNSLSEADRQWLQSFPLAVSETFEGVKMDFFHASPTHNYVLVMPWAGSDELAAQRLSPDTQVSAFGHCHRAFVRHARGCVVVNAGSVGLPYDGDPRPSYALIDVDRGVSMAAIVRVPYDAEAAVRAAYNVGMAGAELFASTARTGQFPG